MRLTLKMQYEARDLMAIELNARADTSARRLNLPTLAVAKARTPEAREKLPPGEGVRCKVDPQSGSRFGMVRLLQVRPVIHAVETHGQQDNKDDRQSQREAQENATQFLHELILTRRNAVRNHE